MVEKFVNSKLPSTFISIDGRYDSCSFKSNWKKESIKNNKKNLQNFWRFFYA